MFMSATYATATLGEQAIGGAVGHLATVFLAAAAIGAAVAVLALTIHWGYRAEAR